MRYRDDTFSLTIQHCNHSDVGIYRVHITNGIDDIQQTTKVNVQSN